jgi:hypothetical protein
MPEPVINLASMIEFPQRRVWRLDRKRTGTRERAANVCRRPVLGKALHWTLTQFALAVAPPQPMRWENRGSESLHHLTKATQLIKTKWFLHQLCFLSRCKILGSVKDFSTEVESYTGLFAMKEFMLWCQNRPGLSNLDSTTWELWSKLLRSSVSSSVKWGS